MTRARDSAPSALAHDAGHALARGAHHARAQPHERLGRAVDAPNLVPGLGYRDGKLLVAQGVRARRARLPSVIARRAAFSAAHISDTGQRVSLRDMNSVGWRRARCRGYLTSEGVTFLQVGDRVVERGAHPRHRLALMRSMPMDCATRFTLLADTPLVTISETAAATARSTPGNARSGPRGRSSPARSFGILRLMCQTNRLSSG